MSQATKKHRRGRERTRPDGTKVISVSVEMPAPLYETVAERARANLRSLSSEVVSMLREATVA